MCVLCFVVVAVDWGGGGVSFYLCFGGCFYLWIVIYFYSEDIQLKQCYGIKILLYLNKLENIKINMHPTTTTPHTPHPHTQTHKTKIKPIAGTQNFTCEKNNPIP